MPDLFHEWGEDLQLSATGGLRLTSGVELGHQRICRRLLTNPGDNLYSPEFGAGLPRYIGSPVSPQRVAANIRKQMRLDAAVQQTPPPNVSVIENTAGQMTASIIYTDQTTSTQVGLEIPVRP